MSNIYSKKNENYKYRWPDTNLTRKSDIEYGGFSKQKWMI